MRRNLCRVEQEALALAEQVHHSSYQGGAHRFRREVLRGNELQARDLHVARLSVVWSLYGRDDWAARSGWWRRATVAKQAKMRRVYCKLYLDAC